MFAATCSSGTGLAASLQLCQAKITSKKISRKVREMLALLSVGLVSSLQSKGGIAGMSFLKIAPRRAQRPQAETAEATRREPGLYGHNGHLAVLVLPLLQHFRLFKLQLSSLLYLPAVSSTINLSALSLRMCSRCHKQYRTENTVFSIDFHLHASVQVCYSFFCFVAGYRGLVPPGPIGYLVQLIKAVDHRRAS